MARRPFPIAVLAGALGLVAAWQWVVAALPRRPTLAESNYQANLLRLQAFDRVRDARPVLAGSSITGRLLEDYFAGTSARHVSNLGLDGSGPALGLELVLTRTNRPAAIFIEANLLSAPQDENDAVLREAFHGMSFTLARVLPFLRAENRPSTRLYDWIKHRADARTAARTRGPAAAGPGPDAVSQHFLFNRQPEAERQAHRRRVRSALEALQPRGLPLILVRFPREGVPDAPRETDFGDELAREFGLPQIALGPAMRAFGTEPAYTDGTHFTPESARLAARILADALTRPPSPPPNRP